MKIEEAPIIYQMVISLKFSGYKKYQIYTYIEIQIYFAFILISFAYYTENGNDNLYSFVGVSFLYIVLFAYSKSVAFWSLFVTHTFLSHSSPWLTASYKWYVVTSDLEF